jgi:hypothetical protein
LTVILPFHSAATPRSGDVRRLWRRRRRPCRSQPAAPMAPTLTIRAEAKRQIADRRPRRVQRSEYVERTCAARFSGRPRRPSRTQNRRRY